MKLANLFKISLKNKDDRKTGGFSGFFRNASDEEKKRVLMEAARRANEEQRELVKKYSEESNSQLKPNPN